MMYRTPTSMSQAEGFKTLEIGGMFACSRTGALATNIATLDY